MAIEDYFKGSSQAYGQLAGSLLAGRRKKDKKEAKRALIASTVMATFGALQNQQKQTIIDGVNDTNEKYNEIFNLNKSEFEAYAPERALLKRYNDSPETFLNEEVAKIINNTDEATAARVTWNDVDKEPDEELRKSMYAAHNSEKQKLKDRMEKLKLDPRATTKSSTAYNQKATDEYKAALALVEDDPTKKGLIKAAWNRIFKTERKDGELVTTNSDLLDLQEKLKDAKDNRTSFRDLQDREVVKRSLITPLVFKDKDLDMTQVRLDVGAKLANVASGYEKYNGTDMRLIDSVFDMVLKENPNLSEQEILSKGVKLVRGDDLNISAFRTREGNKAATGRLLIKTFEKQNTDERLKAVETDPTLKYYLVDAYTRAGDKGQAALVAETYKNVNKDYVDYEANPSVLTTRVNTIKQIIRSTSNDKLLLEDNQYLGDLANRVAHTEHLFKHNNPNYTKEYTQPELTAAAISFVMERDEEGDPTNVRMSKSHMLPYKKNLSEDYVIENLPAIIGDLKNTYKNQEEYTEQITSVRNGLIKIINTNEEFSPDEKLSITTKVENMLKDEGLEPYEKSVAVDEGRRPTTETISQTVRGSSIKEPLIEKTIDYDVMDELSVKGLLDYHKGSRTLFLKNFDETVDSFDFSTTPKEELKYLYLASPNNIKKDLSVDYDTRLTFKGKENNSLQDKIFTTIKTRFIEEGFSNKEADKKTKDELSADTGNFRIPSNEFFETFKSSLLAPSLNPSKSYLYYQKRFNKDY
jgi:hypothetical protein